MFLAGDGGLSGLIAVAGPTKPTMAEAIRRLHGEGLRDIMLTGDNRRTGEAVAARLGIDEVIADLLPQDTEVTLSRLRPVGRIVAMGGDGVNEAPALARANLGLAICTEPGERA